MDLKSKRNHEKNQHVLTLCSHKEKYLWWFEIAVVVVATLHDLLRRTTIFRSSSRDLKERTKKSPFVPFQNRHFMLLSPSP